MMFAKIVSKYLDKPFKKGGHSAKDGYDCYGFVYSFFADMGKKLPHKYGEWNIDNYHTLYTDDRELAEKVMFDALKDAGEQIAPSRVLAGDLVIVKHMNGGHFPAVYIGNGQAMASFIRAGVRTFALKNDNTVVMARRL